MNNKTIIITLQRTGGSVYCVDLARQLGCINIGELFNPWVSPEKFINHILSTNPSAEEKIKYLEETNSWVMKLMPPFIEIKSELLSPNNYRKRPWGGLEFYKKLINVSTNHKFLYRKNFIDQTKSLACAFSSSTFSKNRKNFDVVLTDEEILFARNTLVSDYYKMKDLYDLFPGEIIAYEDFAKVDEKYPDYKNVQGNFDIIEDFDVLKEVFGK
jgi:hypothetical protein